jgi:hypothetical protein
MNSTVSSIKTVALNLQSRHKAWKVHPTQTIMPDFETISKLKSWCEGVCTSRSLDFPTVRLILILGKFWFLLKSRYINLVGKFCLFEVVLQFVKLKIDIECE